MRAEAKTTCLPVSIRRSVQVGNFRRAAAKFRKGPQTRPGQAQRTLGIWRPDISQAWRASCPYRVERSVFRAAVLSIVLTLALGPNAALLCPVWCHPEEAKASACQHQNATTSPRVTGEDSCRTAPTTTKAFVREDAKRGSPTPIAQQTVSSLPFRLGSPPTDTRRMHEATTSLSAVASPLLIALRI